jgi:hypothetical protein
MMNLSILAALLCFCTPSFAAPLPPLPAKSLGVKANAEASLNFKISFKIKDGEIEDAGSFVVMSEAQSNYVAGGEKVFEIDAAGRKSFEFKKHATIVNCIAVAKPSSTIVRAECQFEISGPLAPVGELKARPISTFQYQTAFEVERGHTLVLVDGSSRHIEIKIDVVAP